MPFVFTNNWQLTTNNSAEQLNTAAGAQSSLQESGTHLRILARLTRQRRKKRMGETRLD
jgi:hypothetical protein